MSTSMLHTRISPCDCRTGAVFASVRRTRRLLWAMAGLCLAGAVNAASMKVAFLAPDPAGASPHWDRTIRVMRAAAEDLQIELQVGYSKTNTYTNRKEGMALLTDERKPDYFMTGYWSGATEYLLDKAERLGVHTFIVGSGVVPTDRDAVGVPRQKYRQWLGQMTSDDRRAGYDLAENLIGKAMQGAADTAVHVIGLGGYGDAAVEIARREGLEQNVSGRSGVVLDEFLYAEWSGETAYRSLEKILAADSPVSVVWSASDNMALGAVRAVREAGGKPGKDVLIGGFNWSLPGLEAVAVGDMEVTLGGHFLQGAWSLVLLYDYHQGKDFADDLGTEFETPLHAVTRADAQVYLDVMNDADWSGVDFTRFSKVRNTGLDSHRWPLERVFEQLKQAD